MKRHRIIQRIFMVAGMMFLYLPMVWLVINSFNNSDVVNDWHFFSFRWYREFWHDTELLTAFFISIKLGILTATTSVFIGTWMGYVMTRIGSFRGDGFFKWMVDTSLVIPEVIQGVALLLLFVEIEKYFGIIGSRGFTTIWIGQVILSLSYVTLLMQARIRELDHSFEEAALDLGANPFNVFLHITLPMLNPTLLSAWLVSFTLSFDDVVLAAFLSGPGATTFPTLILSRVRFGLTPATNVVATLFMLVITLVVMLLYELIQIFQKKRSQVYTLLT